jgi:DNA processing protein
MKNFSPHDWLSLLHTPGLGPRTLLPVLPIANSIDDLARLAPEGKQQAFRQLRSGEVEQAVENDLNWLAKEDHYHLITLADERYPSLLKEIADPPLLLFVRGNPDLLSLPQLAIIGSRNPTRQGSDNAFRFARHLAGAGLLVTSGMALGIDAAAHQGALKATQPTIAVTGTGPDRVYPASHRGLAEQIEENGAIVTEFPPGTGPHAGNFPKRNRIISGLSVGTLIVEATLRSGSLITASFASEQGREVFAIPGSIHNPQSRGCHRLIRDGARLVETADDIIEDLASLFATLQPADFVTDSEPAENPVENMDDDYLRLLNVMGWDPVTTDELAGLSGFSAQSVSSMLLLLELQGHVSSAPGGHFIRIKAANLPG